MIFEIIETLRYPLKNTSSPSSKKSSIQMDLLTAQNILQILSVQTDGKMVT